MIQREIMVKLHRKAPAWLYRLGLIYKLLKSYLYSNIFKVDNVGLIIW